MLKNILKILVLTCPALAWGDAAVQLKQSLDEMKTLKGVFQQELRSDDGELLQKSNGDFALKRPGYFYWKNDEPFEQVVIGSPEKIWVFDPDLEQVTIRKNQQKDSPAEILSGSLSELKKTFDVQLKSVGQSHQYMLQPLDKKGAYQYVVLVFEDNQIVSLRFQDQLDQTTQIKFSDTEANAKLDDSLFELNVPEGVEVIFDD